MKTSLSIINLYRDYNFSSMIERVYQFLNLPFNNILLLMFVAITLVSCAAQSDFETTTPTMIPYTREPTDTMSFLPTAMDETSNTPEINTPEPDLVKPSDLEQGVYIVVSNNVVDGLEIFDLRGDKVGSLISRKIFLPSISRDYSSIAYIDLENRFCLEEIEHANTRCAPYDMSRLSSSWSPDGRFLVLDAVDEVSGETLPHIRFMNVDTMEEWRLELSSLDQQQPEWSPFGESIAFGSSHERDSITDLYLMSTSCLDDPVSCPGFVSSPINPTDYSMYDPSWSPDGKKIVVGCGKIEAGSPQDYHLCILDLMTGKVTEMPDNNDNPHNIHWSPDGEWIAFELGAGDIYIISPDGDDAQLLLKNHTFGFWMWIQ